MKGILYKIIGGDKCYYGSTTRSILQRWREHLSNYKLYKLKFVAHTSVYDIFDEYGVDNCKAELILELEFKDRNELLNKEKEYIQNNKCVNIKIPIRSKEEKKMIAKVNSKNYYEINKDTISESKKIKFNCECNSEITKNNKERHFKTRKHLEFLETKE
jgi:hypothetical protein